MTILNFPFYTFNFTFKQLTLASRTLYFAYGFLSKNTDFTGSNGDLPPLK